MATFTLLPSGAWRVQVRRKGTYAADTFLRKTEAQEWAREAEVAIDRGLPPPKRGRPAAKKGQSTLGDVIDLHIADLHEVGKEAARSKSYVLSLLKDELGKIPVAGLTRERLIEYGRKRAREGAGPATVAIDFSYMHTVLTHAAAIHGVVAPLEPLKLARVALVRLGVIGKSKERDRRPTQDELDHITAYLDGNPRQYIPVGRMVRFAVATAMRIEEITRIRWDDVDQAKRTVIIRDRKDPREKKGNNQTVPLLAATGYDAWELLQEQGRYTGNYELIFPYNCRSASTAFHRTCLDLKIEDLCFHDLRHECTSRLFEAGFSIEQVALVTGHKDWKMLRRYTHLRPESLHQTAKDLRERAAQNAAQRRGLAVKAKRTSNLAVVAAEVDSERIPRRKSARRAATSQHGLRLDTTDNP